MGSGQKGNRPITHSDPTRYTLEDVRRSYPPEKAWAEMEGDFPAWLIYRPLSFHVTPLFLRLRIPIFAVTLSSGVLALAMPLVAGWGGPHAYLGVAALGLAFHVLDCVDGNMARTTGRSSRLGGLLDGVIDRSFWILLFLSLGLLVERAGGGVLGDRALELSLGLSILVLLNRQTRDSFALEYADQAYFHGRIPERLSIADKLLIAVVGLEHVYVFAIVLGGAFGVLDRVLVGIAVYVVLIFAGALITTFSQAVRAGEG